ncbi:toxin C-terminal domain-containing protein [Streptomyces longhuiensis]|uniref:toxin C-terminal domain-containing protein n=1 Tax=Streptomyces longhuiensis TaxID=2880933 RepID=UPI002222AD70|nr:toxin C-terminal domain-containing protein [Streptomyces longhuiensis]
MTKDDSARKGIKIWENRKAPAAERFITQDTTGHGGGLFKAGPTKQSLQTTKSNLRSGSYDVEYTKGNDVTLKWIRK